MPGDALESAGFLMARACLPVEDVSRIGARIDVFEFRGAGTRNLLSMAWCRELADRLRAILSQQGLLAADAVSVQCTLFKKSDSRNWKVALHQDLAIPVAAKIDHAALSGWSSKEGVYFVQPPIELMQTMLAVRLHLDPCRDGDGPVCVVPGSHRHGRLDQARTRALDAAEGRVECLAEPGDLLLMRPLLLHASSKAKRPNGARRVLHFLFGPSEPGYGLRWSMAA